MEKIEQALKDLVIDAVTELKHDNYKIVKNKKGQIIDIKDVYDNQSVFYSDGGNCYSSAITEICKFADRQFKIRKGKYDRQAEKDKFFRLEDEEEYEEAAKVAKRYFKYLMDEGCTDLDTGDLLIANSAGFHEGFAMALENE